MAALRPSTARAATTGVLVATYQPTRTNGRHKHPDLNYAIHLDVDMVDFTDAPLSEHPSRNTGLKLDEMLRALRVLASGPGLVAITLA